MLDPTLSTFPWMLAPPSQDWGDTSGPRHWPVQAGAGATAGGDERPAVGLAHWANRHCRAFLRREQSTGLFALPYVLPSRVSGPRAR
jgi:hypothetical protein